MTYAEENGFMVQALSRKPAQRSRSASPFESEDEFADDMQVLIDRLQAAVDECDIEYF